MTSLEYDIEGMLNLSRRAASAVDRGFGRTIPVSTADTGDSRLAEAVDGFDSAWASTIGSLVRAGVDSAVRVGVAAQLYDQADADSVAGSHDDEVDVGAAARGTARSPRAVG